MNILRYMMIIIEQARCISRIRRVGVGFICFAEDSEDLYMEAWRSKIPVLAVNWRTHWNYLMEMAPWEMSIEA